MKSRLIRKRLLLIGMIISMGFCTTAQEVHRLFNLAPNQVYQTEITTNSRAVIERGRQKFSVNSASVLTKQYAVTAKDASGYQMSVKIVKMDNKIDAMGQQFHYNSEGSKDTSSNLIKALDFMLNKPVKVKINNYGVIESYSDHKAEMATDTLVSFAAIQPLIFEKGLLLDFLADFKYRSYIEKGHAWVDDIEIDKQKLHTKFWVEEINEKNTVIKFTSIIEGKLVNSNSNGTYVLDNATGIIMEKLVYTISRGYQISAGKVMYAVARATSLVEKTKPLP